MSDGLITHSDSGSCLLVSIFRRQVTTFPSRPGSISEMKYHRVICQQNRMWQTCRQDFVVVDFYVFGCLLFGQAILVFSGVLLANVKKKKIVKFVDLVKSFPTSI